MNQDSAPLVSVCIVTYNHKNYISQCLDGVLKQQTNFGFEIILGEDESTDSTREICKEYVCKHPDVINLHLRSRKDVIYRYGKPSSIFNFTENIKAARGKYIAIIDGDDYWSDVFKLQTQIDFLENNPDYSFVCCRSEILKEKSGELISTQDDIFFDGKDKIITENNLFSPFLPLTSTIVFRKECIGKINYKALSFGHTFLLFHFLQYGNGYCLNKKMSVYRHHEKGIFNSASKYLNDKKTYFLSIDLLTIYKKQLNSLKELHSSAFKAIFWDAFENKKAKDLFQIALSELKLASMGFDNFFFYTIKFFPGFLKTNLKFFLQKKFS